MTETNQDNENILTGKPDIKYVETAAQVDFAAFKKVVQSRRSVRVFENEAIPDTIVQECLELALLAPNSSNLQPWEFYWIKNPQTQKLIHAACLGQQAATTANALIVCVARTKTWKRNANWMLNELRKNPKVLKSVLNYYQKVVPFFYTVGWLSILGFFKKIILTFLGLSKPIPRGPVSKSQLMIWAVKSTALACENLMLAFRAAGYDTCPMEGFDENLVKKILQLPQDAVVVMVIGAGRRSLHGVYAPQLRFAKENFIFEV